MTTVSAIAIAALLLAFEGAALAMHLAVWEAFVFSLLLISALMWTVRRVEAATTPSETYHEPVFDSWPVGAVDEN